MNHKVHPLRVAVKAIALFALANLVFAWSNPAFGRWSVYNVLFPGRQRFPFEPRSGFSNLSHSVTVEDLDAMFSAHLLSGQAKSSDEFRVLLLGDSGTWGFNLNWNRTLSADLNSLGLETCAGKPVHVYNLAFPGSYLLKDIFILDRAMQYQPDLILWSLTLWSFLPSPDEFQFFMSATAGRAQAVIENYQLNIAEIPPAESFWAKTMVGRRARLHDVFLFQMQALPWSATGIDFYVKRQSSITENQNQDDTILFTGMGAEQSWEKLMPALQFDVLKSGYGIAGNTPLLVVNEPIFQSEGINSDLRYNERYPRWAYDDYRAYLSRWMEANGHPYLDLWDALPGKDFSDAPFHYTSAGERKLAAQIAPAILSLACPHTP